MKNTFILLAFGVALLAFASCKKDSKTAAENITKVVLRLSAPGFEQEFEAKETNGDGIWDSIDEIILPALTGDITCHVHVYDETQSPVVDLTEEIEAESTAHMFTFKVSGADLAVKPNDTDASGKAFNLETLWDAGDVSNGSIQVRLHHDPTDKAALDPGGEVDFDVTFVVKIQ
ncbi:MAG: hypothetical protein Q7T20_00270 [Saprospiraceae bacterium]|nr:hypothetical protein [Saprospiraceae bacterium]